MLQLVELINRNTSDLACTILLREEYGHAPREMGMSLAAECQQRGDWRVDAGQWLSDPRWQSRGAALLISCSTTATEQSLLNACVNAAFCDTDPKVRGIALWLIGTILNNAQGRKSLVTVSAEFLAQNVDIAGDSIEGMAAEWLDAVKYSAALVDTTIKRRAFERNYIERNAGDDAALMLAGRVPEAFLHHPLRGRRLAALMAIRRAVLAGASLPPLVAQMMEGDPDTEVRRCAVAAYRESYSGSFCPTALKRLAGIVLDESQEKIIRVSAYYALTDVARSHCRTWRDALVSRRPLNAAQWYREAAGADWANWMDWDFVHRCRNGLVKGPAAAQDDLLAAIETGLAVKFAAPGLALMSEIQQIDDDMLLREILLSLRDAPTPEALRRVWSGEEER